MEIEIINEESLALQVSKKTIGEIETNAIQIHENVKKVLAGYASKEYTEDNVGEAKKDRALLNKAEKAIKSDLKAIREDFMSPIKKLEAIIGDISKDISKCSETIDSFVKVCETKEKEAKKAKIVDAFNNRIGDNKVVTFESIFKEQWLNKTYSDKLITDEIEKIIADSNQEISIINSSPDKEELMEIYLVKKNYVAAVAELNERKERKKVAESITKEAPKRNTFTYPVSKEEAIKPNEITFKRIFKVEGTKLQLMAINDFISKSGAIYTIEKG